MMLKKEKILTHPASVWGIAFLCCCLWGSAFPMIKLGYEAWGITTASSKILFAGCRFAAAGALVILFRSAVCRRWIMPSKEALPDVFCLSMVQTVAQYLFFYLGLSRTSGVRASILDGSSSFIAILLACFLFGSERFDRKKAIGCLLGLSGMVLVNLGSDALGPFTWDGDGFILISAVAYAASSSLIKKYSVKSDPVMLSGWQFLLGGGVMIVFSLPFGGRLGHTSAAGLGILLYLAFLSAVAYSLWGLLLEYNPVSRVTVWGFLTPVCGSFLSALLLGEKVIGVKTLLSLALVCGGIFVVNTSAGVLSPTGRETPHSVGRGAGGDRTTENPEQDQGCAR